MSTRQFPSYAAAARGLRNAGQDASRAGRAGEPASRFDGAIHLMQEGRWRQAFTRLAALADAGHPQAARIALLFVRRGALLFGGIYHASARQRECWMRFGD